MIELKFANNELIISEIESDLRLRYYFFAIAFIILQSIIFYVACDYDSIFFVPLVILFVTNGKLLKRPANWQPVKIRVEGELVFVDKKILKKEDLIFLSFHQTENCSTIRLEAKRSSIFRPNEAILLNNCKSEDEAISICRVVRDYIDPALQICFVRLVKGKSKRSDFVDDFGDLSNDITFEKRYFIE